MLSVDDFLGLAVGDVIEAGPIFKKLADEPVKLRTAVKEADRAEFVVTYFGVTLGRWHCALKEEKLIWSLS